MTQIVQQQQAALPLELFHHLQQLRERYSNALRAVDRGEYSEAQGLRTVAREVGQLLARLARKSPEERGGLRMVDLALEVDRCFPELRAWNQYEVSRQNRRRLSRLPTPEPRSLGRNGVRAS